MLDEQSIQLSRRVVAHLDGSDLQDVAGFLESGESRPKYDPDPARSGLVVEVDRIAADLQWYFHAVLPEGIPAADRLARQCRFGPTPEAAAGASGELKFIGDA